MAKLTTEQIMVGAEMVERGLPVRQLAAQLGVTEGAVRYRLKQVAEGPQEDGRKGKKTSLDGREEAVRTVLEGLESWRVATLAHAISSTMRDTPPSQRATFTSSEASGPRAVTSGRPPRHRDVRARPGGRAQLPLKAKGSAR